MLLLLRMWQNTLLPLFEPPLDFLGRALAGS